MATREPQKLFRQALDTLPAEITYWEMVLTAPGIPHLYHLEELAPEEYLQKCRDNGIIPYSRLELELHKGYLFPENKRMTSLSFDSPDFEREALADGLVRGGKFADVGISGSHAFKEFKKRYLNTFERNGYWTSSADLWLSYFTSHQHYAEGDYRDGGLRLYDSGLGIGSLGLDTGCRLPEETVTDLVNWLGALKSQYHDGALVELRGW